MDDRITRKKSKSTLFHLSRGTLMALGIASIVLSVVVLALSVWEGFGGVGRFHRVELPGFHELELKSAGLYAGMYQHAGTGPMPAKEISRMDIRIMSKGDYEEIPVLMNTTGQTFTRFGVQGMPVFNFVVENAGSYTLSAVYLEETNGPRVPVLIFPQSAQNIKQTLIVGSLFFVLFLALGIFILVRLRRWAPKEETPPEVKVV